MKKIPLIFVLNLFLFNHLTSESIFKIRLINSPNNKVNDVIVLNYQDVQPKNINDSVAIYAYNPDMPTNLLIVLDRKSRWHTFAWLNPKNDTVEMVVDFSKKVTNLAKPKKWDLVFENYCSFSDNDKTLQADSVASEYILKNKDSYLSLWFLSHGVAFENKSLKAKLFSQLDLRLATYKEYQEIKSDIGERRIPSIGEQLKEFALVNSDESNYESTNTKNKIIVLHFWSNNCGPCVKGMDDLVKTTSTLDTSKVAFVSISIDDDKEAWHASKTTNKITWTNLWQAGGIYGNLCLTYNLRAIPLFVIFDKDKKLYQIIEGEDLYSINKAISDLSNTKGLTAKYVLH